MRQILAQTTRNRYGNLVSESINWVLHWTVLEELLKSSKGDVPKFARMGNCGPAHRGMGMVLGLTPSGFVSNSSWTVRGGRSERRAADVVRPTLTPSGGAAPQLHPRVQLTQPPGAAGLDWTWRWRRFRSKICTI